MKDDDEVSKGYVAAVVILCLLVALLGFISKSKAAVPYQDKAVMLQLTEPTSGATALLSCVTVTTYNKQQKEYK